MTLEDIHQFEYWLELGFSQLLDGLTVAPVYDSSTRSLTAKTPRIEVKAIIGPNLEHRHNFTNSVAVNQGSGTVAIPLM